MVTTCDSWRTDWTKQILDPYGSTESARIDGTLVSALVTWDSKVLNCLALFGGVQDLVRQKLKADGHYAEFISIASVSSQ